MQNCGSFRFYDANFSSHFQAVCAYFRRKRPRVCVRVHSNSRHCRSGDGLGLCCHCLICVKYSYSANDFTLTWFKRAVATSRPRGFCLQLHISSWSQRNNYVVHDFAQNMLKKLPPNAIVLTKGDLPTNSMRYARQLEAELVQLQLQILSPVGVDL